MILPDVNIILHAYNSEALAHLPARKWWESTLSSPHPLALCWTVMLGFIRISTNPRIFRKTLPVSVACGEVRAWLSQPQVVILEPGRLHASILFDLLERRGAGGNLTTDAHLAALAIEHQCELYTTDGDFADFPGLHWTNPLTSEL